MQVSKHLGRRDVIYAHVLRRHLELILAEGVEPTQSDIRVGDAVLPSREQLEVVA
jgi:hypothetical protein